jgi:sec-independent protein translocase protein TatC
MRFVAIEDVVEPYLRVRGFHVAPRSTIREMGRTIRMAGADDRLTLTDHLDELRSRLIVSLVALALAFGLCLWQSHRLLYVINEPLTKQTQHQVAKGSGPLGQTALAQQAVLKVAGDTEELARILSAPESRLPVRTRAALQSAIPRLRGDVANVPRTPQGDKPVTLGVGEPFATTIQVALYFALVLALPVILFELYGFVMPGLTPEERRAVRPLLWSVPVLFAGGVLFGYFVVLPAAVRFLQNFNSGEFNVLVQAGPYYKFAASTLLVIGLSFELPVAILGAVRAGLVTPQMLRKGRRFALAGCVVIAAMLPGDIITMALEALPLYVLYEVSIVVAVLSGRRREMAPASAASRAGIPT